MSSSSSKLPCQSTDDIPNNTGTDSRSHVSGQYTDSPVEMMNDCSNVDKILGDAEQFMNQHGQVTGLLHYGCSMTSKFSQFYQLKKLNFG